VVFSILLRGHANVGVSPHWALTKGFAVVAHEMLASPPLPFPCHMHRLALAAPRDPG
jgi:hypothetical protein